MPTPNMNLTLPVEGGDNDNWDVVLNDAIELVDAHDHTTGKGVKIPAAALNINADTPWNSAGTYYALTGVKALDFQPLAAALMSAYAGALFMSSADNELYWRTSGGTNVKLTNGASLNASIIGGIGGDYASVGALLDYDDATDTYRLRQELSTVRQYGRVAHADLDLYEYDPAGDVSVPANRVRLKSPDALGASYDITWLTALPGSTQLMQVSSAGQLSASNTIANAVSMGSTLGVTGLITADAGLTAAAAQHITISTTGRYKRGALKRRIQAASAEVGGTLGTTAYNGTNRAWHTGNAGAIVYFPLDVYEGERITAVAVRGIPIVGGVGDTFTLKVFRIDASGTGAITATQLGSTQTSSGDLRQTLTVSGLTEVASDHYTYVAEVAAGTYNSGVSITDALLTTDVP